MPHYSDKKSFMVSAIRRIVRDIEIDTQKEAENSIKCPGEICSEAELSEQRLESRLKAPNYETLVKKSKKFSKNATETS